jgi:hypothetical protein
LGVASNSECGMHEDALRVADMAPTERRTRRNRVELASLADLQGRFRCWRKRRALCDDQPK